MHSTYRDLSWTNDSKETAHPPSCSNTCSHTYSEALVLALCKVSSVQELGQQPLKCCFPLAKLVGTDIESYLKNKRTKPTNDCPAPNSSKGTGEAEVLLVKGPRA